MGLWFSLLFLTGLSAQETRLPSGLQDSCKHFEKVRERLDRLSEDAGKSPACRDKLRESMAACRAKNGPTQKQMNEIVIGAGERGAVLAQRDAYASTRDSFLAQAGECEELRAQVKGACDGDVRAIEQRFHENQSARTELEHRIAAANNADRAELRRQLGENANAGYALQRDLQSARAYGKVGDEAMGDLAQCNVGTARIYSDAARGANTMATSISADAPTDERGVMDKYQERAEDAAKNFAGGTLASKVAGTALKVAVPMVAGPGGYAADVAIDQLTATPTAKCSELYTQPELAYQKGCRPTVLPNRSPSSGFQDLESSGF